MASLSINLFSSLPRLHINRNFYSYMNSVQLRSLGSKSKWVLTAVSDETVAETIAKGGKDEQVETGKRTRRASKRTPSGTRKKSVVGTSDDESLSSENGNVRDEEGIIASGPTEDSKKTKRITRKKTKVLDASDDDSLSAINGNVSDSDNSKKSRRATQKKATTSSGLEKDSSDKKVTKRRGSRKVFDDSEDQGSEIESSYHEEEKIDDDKEDVLELDKDGGEDSSFTSLVCCFGAAQHAFVPSVRQGNRPVDHEALERRKDIVWVPEQYMRAPGGSTGDVAVALGCLGGKVSFMGKLGNDELGQFFLDYMNFNNVQTRSVCIDNKNPTAISKMKITKRGGLKMTSLKPCAEDSLSKSEINIDVLKETKLFYFSTFSLLDPNMRSTAFRAMNISKKLGGLVFYDLNLPLPLWQSSDETKAFVQAAWDLADIIEVTKQELEFLCGIDPVEIFDTRDNNGRPKHTHYTPEVIAPLWHENLKVLLVTNGTSRIHYYTKEHNGVVLGKGHAPPLTPYTSDMSAAGDATIAGILRMLANEPHLITDKVYLEHSIKYAIKCGAINQWLLARKYGYPPKEGMEDDVVIDPRGIRSVTEHKYRTLVPAVS